MRFLDNAQVDQMCRDVDILEIALLKRERYPEFGMERDCCMYVKSLAADRDKLVNYVQELQSKLAIAQARLEQNHDTNVAELNRRRSTDSAVRQTLKECGAPDNHSIHSQIEWLAKRNVRRRRLLEQAVSELLDLHGNHSTAALNVCTGCRLIAEIREESAE